MIKHMTKNHLGKEGFILVYDPKRLEFTSLPRGRLGSRLLLQKAETAHLQPHLETRKSLQDMT